jgi:hypothetical protein
MSYLTPADKATFEDRGYIHLPGRLADRIADISAWIEELEQRCTSGTSAKVVEYWEEGTGGAARKLGRLEHFVDASAGLGALLTSGELPALASELFGEPAVLFKEKINFKLAGSGAFAAHQDAPAYTQFGQTLHVTVAICIDAATPANGCLEFAGGRHRQVTYAHPSPDNLIIAPAVEDEMEFEPVVAERGDVLIFDSYVPHRSPINRSDRPRRMIFATYGRLSEGDHRAAYYRFKFEHPDDPTLNVALPFHATVVGRDSSAEADASERAGGPSRPQ